MPGWGDRIRNWADKWTQPIEGIDGPDRDPPRFKKGDIVTSTRNPERKGRVYRAIEWGDKWKYGVEWEDGQVDKATDMIRGLGESVVLMTVGDIREAVRRVLKDG